LREFKVDYHYAMSLKESQIHGFSLAYLNMFKECKNKPSELKRRVESYIEGIERYQSEFSELEKMQKKKKADK